MWHAALIWFEFEFSQLRYGHPQGGVNPTKARIENPLICFGYMFQEITTVRVIFFDINTIRFPNELRYYMQIADISEHRGNLSEFTICIYLLEMCLTQAIWICFVIGIRAL